ncbi:MAG: MMPL family transporter [Clostridiales bacterium]|jgi:predicted RND superfamily exporter protein|nr:MMPL family transporter [Clostridiales bacterium]
MKNRADIVGKLANTVVKGRYIILGVMLLLAVVCLTLIPKVDINSDMTKYMPDGSSMKVGLDIMNDEFSETETAQTIRVMFDGLNQRQIAKVLSDLRAIPYVDGVAYEADSPDYNRDGHTLFVVSTSYAYGSDEEKSIEAAIAGTISRYEATIINDGSGAVEVPLWIAAVAMAILTIIMLVMCNSWIEPFLFLAAIGCAIAINMGSNVFLGGISSTTASIAAILQLVLSLDYSIMLMNRYRQELQLTESKTEAMKNALKNVFFSIGGSATTTIIGLLMLLFMSFKIGADLGIVLAKGVAISLLCTFTVLPGLILPLDKLLKKTAKKSLNIRTGGLARFGFKGRHVLAGVFVVLFGGSLFLQSFAQTTYSLKAEDAIADVFPKSNSIVLLYENYDSDSAAKIAELIAADPYVKSALSYSTTIGKPYSAAELASAISAMGADAAIDPAMLDIIFYSYYSQGQAQSMTAGEFLRFIADNADNPLFSAYAGDSLKEYIAEISKFSDAAVLTRPMNAAELSDFLGIEREQAEMLFVYYFALSDGYAPGSMTITEFVDFLLAAADNPLFEGQFDQAALEQIQTLKAYTDPEPIQRQMTYTELAEFFGQDAAMAAFIYALNFTNTMSPEEYVDYILLELAPSLSGFNIISAEQLEQLEFIQPIMKAAVSGEPLSYYETAQMLGMESAMIKMLYTLDDYASKTDSWTLSVQTVINFIADNTDVFGDMPAELSQAKTVIDAVVLGRSYAAAELAAVIGDLSPDIDANTLELLYLYYGAQNAGGGLTLSIQSLFDYLANDIVRDPRFERVIDEKFRGDIAGMKAQLDAAVLQLKGKNYSRLIIETTLPDESEETDAFLANLIELCEERLVGNYYLIGNSPMSYEMSKSFGNEMLFITILTALAIFIVVAIIFRSLTVPAILVLLVQCGVFITVAASGLIGYDMYYLSSLIVQCILMGATIDYGILFAGYYRENRKTMEAKEALSAAYKGSIHTILTSASIMVLVLGVIGMLPCDPAIGTICQTLSIGALFATLLILLVLPGLLVTFDKLVTKARRARTKAQ